MSDIVTLIRNARFASVRMRLGYARKDVDELMDGLVAAVRTGEPVAPLIEQRRPPAQRLQDGYDAREVDQFLASVIRAVPAAPEPVEAGEGQPEGWILRLFGSR